MAQLKYLDLEGVESLINQTIDRIEKEAEDTLNFVDSQKGAANGIAGLDSSKKVLSTNLPIAGTSLGAIKNGYSSSGKNYAVVVNTDGTAYVNVPWESATITAATDSVIGGFLIGYQESGRNFAVKLDNNKAYVTVPQTSLTDLGINVTASNLNNVDITSSLTSLLSSKLNASLKGQANGLAELDQNGHILSSQLPSSVDEIVEITNLSGTGESGKIYVNTTDNKTYRWSGSQFVEISASLALGETETTAFRGDHGNAAYTHSLITTGNPHGTKLTDLPDYNDTIESLMNILAAKADITGTNASGTWGISITGNAASASKLNTNAGSANQPVYFANGVPVALNYTIQTSVPANAKFTDTTYSNATSSAAGLMSQTDKAKLDSMDSDIQNQVDGKAASNATFYIGTTQIALGRASAAQTLAGTSISGNAATATKLSSAGSINITGDVTASGVTYTNGGNVTLNTIINVYKDYISYKFTEATTSYTIPSLSSYHNPDVEVFFNGFLLRPTIDGITGEYALDSETGVITFTNTLGGTGAEQELIIVIRSFQALPGRVATPVITVVN